MAVHGKIGFRVRTDVPRPPAALVERFREHASSNLADAMGRFHFMDFGIRPRSGLGLSGVAVTVDARPGDNLMIHKALEVASPGDIVDVEAITALGFPAFSRAICAGGCDKDGPGEVNSPIACGNTVVMPGDIVVGDDDGVV